jgi:enhancing lycopene biosynthesis protein 2
MKAAIILAGSGVYDGSEIHESVFTLLALEEAGIEYSIFAPDKNQHHVINHLTGDEMPETRNVLVESARIARGAASPLSELKVTDADFLVIPGGFGAAKNLNQWALKGPDGDIDTEVNQIINDFVTAKKPICGLCMGPTVIAQALKGSDSHPTLTIGSITEKSPYDIDGINQGIASTGSKTTNKSITEIQIDEDLKIVTAPCYMMEASLLQVRNNIKMAIDATLTLAKK